jgi:hypothetical protein
MQQTKKLKTFKTQKTTGQKHHHRIFPRHKTIPISFQQKSLQKSSAKKAFTIDVCVTLKSIFSQYFSHLNGKFHMIFIVQTHFPINFSCFHAFSSHFLLFEMKKTLLKKEGKFIGIYNLSQ